MSEIEIILKTPRVFFAEKNNSNFTVGLYELIKKHVKPDFEMVEIGSFSGVSSALFALHAKKIHCVDMWSQYVDSGSSSTLLITQEQLNLAESNFDKVAAKYNNVVKVKKASLEAAKEFKDESLDMVYIDSAHDFKTVNEDIVAWLPKVKKGGIVAGHDIRIKGVQKAVYHNFASKDVESFADTSWLTYKAL